MEYSEQLNVLEKKYKLLPGLGDKLFKVSDKQESYYFVFIAALNRTVNVTKAYITLMRDNNYLAAASFVRINLDTLLRLYAYDLVDLNRNEFANYIIEGKHINKLKHKETNSFLRDKLLCTEFASIKGNEWVLKVYETANSFIHFESSYIYSCMDYIDKESRKVNLSIGEHDNFVSNSEKHGSAVFMNLIVENIIEQSLIYIYEISKKYDFDFESLND